MYIRVQEVQCQMETLNLVDKELASLKDSQKKFLPPEKSSDGIEVYNCGKRYVVLTVILFFFAN